MAQQSEQQPQTPEELQPETGRAVEWRIHPVTRRPWVSVGVTIIILVFSFLVQVSTDSKFFTFLSLVVLFASLAKFYFPTTYRLTEKEVIIKTTTQTLRKEWTLYRSYWIDKNGVLLSPFATQSRLENFRGLYLIFGDNRDEAIAFIKDRMAKPEGETA